MQRDMAVLPYEEKWITAYRDEKNMLEEVLGNLALDIQHFGSTAVKGMCAKPVIDIMVVVKHIQDIDVYNQVMAEKGFIAQGEKGIPGRRYFVRYQADGINHAAHVHIYERDNPRVADELLFRDFLRIDSQSFQAYAAVKLEAAHKYRFSPARYVDAKAQCIKNIMEKARAHYQIKPQQEK